MFYLKSNAAPLPAQENAQWETASPTTIPQAGEWIQVEDGAGQVQSRLVREVQVINSNNKISVSLSHAEV